MRGECRVRNDLAASAVKHDDIVGDRRLYPLRLARTLGGADRKPARQRQRRLADLVVDQRVHAGQPGAHCRAHAFHGEAQSEIAGGLHDQRDELVRIVGRPQLFLEEDIRQHQRAEPVERLASGTHARSSLAAIHPAMSSMTAPARSRTANRPSPSSVVHVPSWTILPSSRTAIRSALRKVERRCAMTMTVVLPRSRSRTAQTARSLSWSSALVASSRINKVGLRNNARAKTSRWRSPPESRLPRSPTTVASPSGIAATIEAAPVIVRA